MYNYNLAKREYHSTLMVNGVHCTLMLVAVNTSRSIVVDHAEIDF